MAEVLSRRPSALYYLYALVDRAPRRWRPPATGVGGGSIEARHIHDLILIVSRVVNPVFRTVRTQAAHDDVLASLMDAEAVAPMPFGTAVVDLQGWVDARLPRLPFADRGFDAVISNSLLHHLPEPATFWSEVRRLLSPGGVVHVMDLFRPGSVDEARAIVEAAAGDEDPILKDDFFNSLLAAFTPDEVRGQLTAAGLGHLECVVVSERHVLVTGRR